MTSTEIGQLVPERPRGTVTFLFTDIEGSANRWEDSPQEMRAASSRQEAILRGAIESNGGLAYKQVGDALQVAFHTAPQAVQAALDAQRALQSEEWAGGGELSVRMALHTGVVEEREDDYVGPVLNRLARLLSAGYGGQVLLTYATAELARDDLPDGASLKELGEHRLKDLFRPETVFQLVAPGLPSEFPPLKTLGAKPNNLPLQPTQFMGREREVGEVVERLLRGDVRLLTLTGPGGIGKSRLALQAAADLLDDFPDGVYFVPLAAITDPTLVTSAIAQTLDVREQGGQPLSEVLREHLREKQLLLVLDNFEQVLEAAKSVSDLLMAAPHLKVLVSSRASLHLSAEHQYPVPPLSLPPTGPGQPPSVERLTQYEAVALFIARARAASSSFEVNNENAPAVAEICVRLDGLPLAIELAAARIKLLSPAAMLQRLESRLGGANGSKEGSRLKFLTGGARDLPTRQQTLRSAIEWSYDLLSDGEKELFRRLAVFVSDTTLEQIETVCNAEGDLQVDVLDGMESLVDKSLLRQGEGRVPGVSQGARGETRFVMLETICEFAREKLQESGEMEVQERQHALYFMGFAEEAEPQLTGPDQAVWLERLEEEHDNIRAALHWARNGGESGSAEALEIGLRTGGALWRFWSTRGYLSEGRAQLTSLLQLDVPQVIDAPGTGPSENQGEAHPASTSGITAARAKAYNGAANLSSDQGDYDTARSFHEQSLALRREIGDKRGIAASLNNLGLVAYRLGDFPAARSFHEQSLAIKKERGDKWGMSSSFMNLGLLAQEQGDFASARSLYEQSLVIKKELEDKDGIAILFSNLGSLAGEQGDYAFARSMYEQSLALQRELGDKRGMAISLNELGVIDCMRGNYSTGVPLIEESLALSRETGDKRGLAYSLSSLGMAASMQGEYTIAHSYYKESLVLRREIGSKRYISYSLALIGDVAVSRGRAEEGGRLLGATEALLESTGSVLDAEHRLIYERAAAAARSQLGEEAFESAQAEGRAMSLEQAMEYALRES